MLRSHSHHQAEQTPDPDALHAGGAWKVNNHALIGCLSRAKHKLECTASAFRSWDDEGHTSCQ